MNPWADILGLLISGGALCAASYWVYRDSIRRGRSPRSAARWSAWTFLALIIVLPLHLITRPKLQGRPTQ